METKNIISAFTLSLITSFSISAQDTIYDEKVEQLLNLSNSYSVQSEEDKEKIGFLPEGRRKQTNGEK